jgi:hypothetical protein
VVLPKAYRMWVSLAAEPLVWMFFTKYCRPYTPHSAK